jgi:hypothetical protein
MNSFLESQSSSKNHESRSPAPSHLPLSMLCDSFGSDQKAPVLHILLLQTKPEFSNPCLHFYRMNVMETRLAPPPAAVHIREPAPVHVRETGGGSGSWGPGLYPAKAAWPDLAAGSDLSLKRSREGTEQPARSRLQKLPRPTLATGSAAPPAGIYTKSLFPILFQCRFRLSSQRRFPD